MVCYSHLFQNFPQFIVIHTVKGFGIVNKAEIDIFLELSCFFDDPADVGIIFLKLIICLLYDSAIILLLVSPKFIPNRNAGIYIPSIQEGPWEHHSY